jgi:hypothetical protein
VESRCVHKCLQAWRGRARRSQGHKAPSGDGDNDMRKAIDLARKSALLVLRDYFSFACNSSAIRKRAHHGLEEHTVCENAIYHQLKGGGESRACPKHSEVTESPVLRELRSSFPERLSGF